MYNGDIDRFIWRRRVVVGLLALGVAAAPAGCTTAATKSGDAPVAGAASPSTVPAKHFGPASFGKLTITMTEKDALATGELQTSPVSTVLGKNVYSFVGGPKPDPKQMAADDKTEKAVEKADAGTDQSAAGSAKAAEAYADSAQRIVERLESYLDAGGASFRGGALHSIAAPKDAATEAGIKRGSTLAELKAACAGKGLKSSSKTAYELPVAGHAGWTILFELKDDTVKYMSIGKAG
ncbi:hypothetical protein DMB66_37400 [Actinoplanes sp. ATCC 53533]|uniref:hypothetical protein n=1 Tax=Actinoplanes sp. ATCC 53533 TaxID=1288362 RepID=UPI000F78F44D|nr:hypothetical protein [Actinoplanes sp. ATCC 53533]RSM54622.1 hypothetical protein DMB66_37400 [Actinoplanes sp. ATCC 53533]